MIRVCTFRRVREGYTICCLCMWQTSSLRLGNINKADQAIPAASTPLLPLHLTNERYQQRKQTRTNYCHPTHKQTETLAIRSMHPLPLSSTSQHRRTYCKPATLNTGHAFTGCCSGHALLSNRSHIHNNVQLQAICEQCKRHTQQPLQRAQRQRNVSRRSK